MRSLHRVLALALAVLLAGSHGSLCVGWEPSAEARMACCAEGEPCAMHQSHESATHSEHQTQADDCCLLSEGGRSRESSPAFVVVAPRLTEADVVLSTRIPALVLSTRWTAPPITNAEVPRYLLLSVFLV